ncbi:MAG: class I SAM-dependent methyltransferase [Candidatus Omnitrophica bacterium]|nr:class I SAM-dependent methyltransferase [Candidatus Omnitrophota bacterium]
MAHIDFVGQVHRSTKRDYLARVMEGDKAEYSQVAIQWGREYWDGDRRYGYGGFRYDGRWRPVAEQMVKHYGLQSGDSVLDVGCGKGFLLYEFTQALPGIRVAGIDISAYAVENGKEEVKPFLKVGTAAKLPFPDRSFDLVVSLTTLHNLYLPDLWSGLREIERVGKKSKYIEVESYRSEREKVNLLYWQLTCRAFHTPAEWEWLFRQVGYTGDHSFIFFE